MDGRVPATVSLPLLPYPLLRDEREDLDRAGHLLVDPAWLSPYLEVPVEREDIDCGTPEDEHECALARAVRRCTGCLAWCYRDGVVVHIDRGSRSSGRVHRLSYSDPARRLVEAYDAREAVEPRAVRLLDLGVWDWDKLAESYTCARPS